MLKTLLSLSFLFVYLFAAHAQDIIIGEGDFRQEANGNVYLRMVINQKNSPRERYNVQLFSSFNGGNFQRLSVSRNDVAPGEPVIFNLSPSDLGGNGTQLQLRVEIEATTFPLKVQGTGKVKTGKPLSVSWQGYNETGSYKVELIDDLNRSVTIGEENSNSFTKTLDKDTDKGNYTLRVTPAGSPNSYGEMDLKVSGGVSPWIIIAPVALGGGAAAYFIFGPPEPEDPEVLPNPPGDPDAEQ